MTAPSWTGGGGGAPPTRPPGLDRRIVIGGVAIVVVAALAFFAVIGAGSSEPDPGPAPGSITLDEATGAGATGAQDTAVETTPSLPEPYGSLEVAAVRGCTYDCFGNASFSVATTDGLRKVARRTDQELRVRVTMTNPTPFDAVVTAVGHDNTDAFQRLNTEAQSGVPLCPIVGEVPIKLAAKADTTCEVAFRFADDDPRRITIGVDISYLIEDGDGALDEEQGRLVSSSLSSIEVSLPAG